MADKSNAGRPTKFDESQLKIIGAMCKLGATDQNLADALEVSIATINNWKNDFPEFLDTLKQNKELANSLVEQALFKRAMGAKVNEVKVVGNELKDVEKEYPPDVGACVVWLANRDPDRWKKDGVQAESTNDVPVGKIQIEVVSANTNDKADTTSS